MAPRPSANRFSPADPVPLPTPGAAELPLAGAASERTTPTPTTGLRVRASEALGRDVRDYGVKHRIGIERAGIQRVGVGRSPHRRGGPLAVAAITLGHLGKNARPYSVGLPPLQLPRPPHRACLEAGGQEDLDARTGTDDGADVAPVQHRAGRPAGRVGGK